MSTALIIVLLSSLWLGAAMSRPANEVFPGARWESKTPQDVGMSQEALEAFSRYVGGRGCVVRHGYMVYTWGDAAQRGDVASAVKPWYAHFLFKALEEGKIASIDEPVAAYEPRLMTLNPALGYKDRQMTWRHLATQTACYGVAEKPGTAFDYNDWQMALFFDTLFLKVYGATLATVDEEVLHSMLTDRLECQDEPTFLAFGDDERAGRLAISPRDFARFGLLYLHEGRWRDEQLLSRAYAKLAVTDPLPNSIPRTAGQEAEMIPGQRSIGSRAIPDNQSDHLGSYSWLWWTNGVDRQGKRHWPDAPLDTFGAVGHWGIRALYVIPGLDLIVSWNNTQVRGPQMENEALRLLTEAVVDADPMQGQIVVDGRHRQWLKRKGGGPVFICGPGDPEGFLYRGKLNPDGTRDGDQMALIRKLNALGGNCIYLMAVRSHGGDGDSTQNPFVDHDPAKGLNQKVLDQWETWFTVMDRNNIVIFFFFYDDNACIWDTGDQVGEQEAGFIRALVDRFEHHRNLIWCVAEEYSERFSPQRVRNIAGIIRSADDYNHVIAVHKHSGLRFDEFANDPNIDQFAIQYNVGSAQQLHEGMVQAWRIARGRYNLNMSEAADFGTGAVLRQKLWACAMGGAYVMVLGMNIADTPKSDLEDCGRLVRFMEATNFNEMAPHDELALGDTQYVLARPGHSYILYTAQADGKVGVRGMKAGVYELRWFDCATGRSVIQPQVKVAGGNVLWTKPAGVGNELALYVRRCEPAAE